ncbi:MAG: EAL domain-containing protein [Thiotrichales bacterium]|nr:EAL domain-containing protein [Thiotrichales bacterium]
MVEFAQKIIDLTKEPILIDSQALYLSSSIGISLYPKDTTSIDDLLKYADAAMYRAKDLGRNNVQFYTEDMTQMAFEHVAMQASLRQAIKNNEFVVAYQPQVDAAQHKVMGMEALVRWNHPLMGMVQPNKFIPLAESTGMIVELDRLVMQSAMLQWADWHQQGLDLGVLSMNLSVKQIQQADFIDFLQSSLLSTQCHPDWLCLEVTESAVMKNLDEMKAVLIKIRALGISIAVDDFGTGYSSLAYLKRLPVSKLKIDRSFIRDLPDDEEDATITRTIIIMAKNLGLEVIAEGVETAEQQAFLLENGCPDIQGFLYAQPLLKAPLEAWLTEFNAQGA